MYARRPLYYSPSQEVAFEYPVETYTFPSSSFSDYHPSTDAELLDDEFLDAFMDTDEFVNPYTAPRPSYNKKPSRLELLELEERLALQQQQIEAKRRQVEAQRIQIARERQQFRHQQQQELEARRQLAMRQVYLKQQSEEARQQKIAQQLLAQKQAQRQLQYARQQQQLRQQQQQQQQQQLVAQLRHIEQAQQEAQLEAALAEVLNGSPQRKPEPRQQEQQRRPEQQQQRRPEQQQQQAHVNSFEFLQKLFGASGPCAGKTSPCPAPKASAGQSKSSSNAAASSSNIASSSNAASSSNTRVPVIPKSQAAPVDALESVRSKIAGVTSKVELLSASNFDNLRFKDLRVMVNELMQLLLTLDTVEVTDESIRTDRKELVNNIMALLQKVDEYKDHFSSHSESTSHASSETASNSEHVHNEDSRVDSNLVEEAPAANAPEQVTESIKINSGTVDSSVPVSVPMEDVVESAPEQQQESEKKVGKPEDEVDWDESDDENDENEEFQYNSEPQQDAFVPLKPVDRNGFYNSFDILSDAAKELDPLEDLSDKPKANYQVTIEPAVEPKLGSSA